MGTESDSAETEFERVDLDSQPLTAKRLEGLRELFPEVFTECRVDFDALRLSLGEMIDSGTEHFGLTWPGKAEAARSIQQPSVATLEPMREESLNWDETENLIIEGDNLETLKLLQRSYHSRIKLIYMDPPYNTGNEFVYKDNYKEGLNAYLQFTNQADEEGNKLVSNPTTSGRYHSDWLTMIYPRLLLARNLLRDDGFIFISIGQEEVANLSLLVREVFGRENFLGLVTRVTKTGSNKGTFFAPSVDYLVVAARSVGNADCFSVAPAGDYEDKYKETDEDNRKYLRHSLYHAGLDPMRGCTNQRYWVKCPDGSLCIPPGETFPPENKELSKVSPQSRADKVWRWSDARYQKEHSELVFREANGVSKLVTPEGKNSKWNVFTKQYLSDRLEKGFVPRDFLTGHENTLGTKELKELGLKEDFDFPKPTSLIQWCIELACEEGVVLDIFAGSGTTGDAVLKANSEDGNDRSYIAIQLPEPTKNTSFNNITEITRQRMRLAADRIMKNSPELALNGGGGQEQILDFVASV